MKQDLKIKLKYKTQFQTIKKIDNLPEKFDTPIKIPSSNNYLFPEGYSLDKIITDTKKFVEVDGADSNAFPYGFEAKSEVKISNPLRYINKAREIFRNLYTELVQHEKANELSGNLYNDIIQSCHITNSTDGKDKPMLLMAHLGDGNFYDSSNLQVHLAISIPFSNIELIFKSNGNKGAFRESNAVEQLEKFYNAVNDTYTKLLGE